MQLPEKSSTATFSQGNLPPELSMKLSSEWIINIVLKLVIIKVDDLDSKLSPLPNW